MKWDSPQIRRLTAPAICALAAIASLSAAGCGDVSSAPKPSYQQPAGPGVCAPRDDEASTRGAPALEVFPNIQAIGSASNEIVPGAGYLWVVESTSNTVSRFDPDTGRYDAHFIDVGDGRNPYNIAIDAEHARVYITNWLTDTLSVADLHTGEILAEVDEDTGRFDAPQGITLTPERIYVANTAYRGPGDYGLGSVTVLRRETLEFIGRVQTGQRNTTFVKAISTPAGPGVVIVNSGALEVTNEGAFVRGVSGIEVWTERPGTNPPFRQYYPLERSDDPRMGAPGRPVLGSAGKTVYFPSATAPVVFKFDLEAGEWVRGTQNPIFLHASVDSHAPITADGTFNAALDARGILYLSALNEDAIYLLDTACDAVLTRAIPVGTTDAQLEGPQDLTVIEDGDQTQVYFVMTLSNAMGKMTLNYGPEYDKMSPTNGLISSNIDTF